MIIELIFILLSVIVLAVKIIYQWHIIRQLGRSLDWDRKNIELLHDIVRTLSADNRELKTENARHQAELGKHRSRGEVVLISGNQVFRVWRN